MMNDVINTSGSSLTHSVPILLMFGLNGHFPLQYWLQFWYPHCGCCNAATRASAAARCRAIVRINNFEMRKWAL